MRLGYGMRLLLIGKSLFHYSLSLHVFCHLDYILRVFFFFYGKLILTVEIFFGGGQGSEAIYRDSLIYTYIYPMYNT